MIGMVRSDATIVVSGASTFQIATSRAFYTFASDDCERDRVVFERT
jgi:hypothetical protein